MTTAAKPARLAKAPKKLDENDKARRGLLPVAPPPGEPADDEVPVMTESRRTPPPTDEDLIDVTPPPDPMEAAAYHGILGEIVRVIEPETEAPAEGLLGHLLIGVGNLIGPSPFYPVGPAKHRLNEFGAFVGPTCSGMKGTTLTWALEILRSADPAWREERVSSGLSSGEGLIEKLKDPDPAVGGRADQARRQAERAAAALAEARGELEAARATADAARKAAAEDPEDKARAKAVTAADKQVSATQRKVAPLETRAEKARSAREDAERGAPVGPGGPPDRRALVLATEFGAVLKVATRDGSTLTDVLRQAWDGQTLEVMTKNSPAKATDPHIAILAHITPADLRKNLANEDALNGFANRFLWFYVKSDKRKPDGGRVPEESLAPLRRRLAAAVSFARRAAEVRRDREAEELWRQVYPGLKADRPGRLGAVLDRAAPHVTRLSLLYALLDQSSHVQVAHLEAALAVWRYCERSVRFAFGESHADPTAEKILAAVRAAPEGLTTTDVWTVVGHHKSKAEVSAALQRLVAGGLVRQEKIPTGGRPTVLWKGARPLGATPAA